MQSGRHTVPELVQLTGASAITVRRDLSDLADLGAIRRIRGGAEPVAKRGSAYPFALRRDDLHDQKQAIAEAAAAMVQPGDCILLDNGTTAIAVAHCLSGVGVTAMALSLHVAAALATRTGDEIIVPGGPIDQDDLSFTSAGAAEAVRDMRYDLAIISACAADPSTGLSVERWGDARVKQAALRSASRVVLLATVDKFTRTAAHVFANFADIDTIITTDDIPAHIIRELQFLGPQIVTVHLEVETG